MTLRTTLLALAVLPCCAACSKPAPPETERPPEPRAQAAAPQATGLNEAIREPIERARAVEADVQDAAAKQAAAIDAQTGG